jgi:hypothetical protein
MDDQDRDNLVRRIKDIFPEIDSAAVVGLREADEGYAVLCGEITDLQRDFPVIARVVEGEGAVSMSAEEHEAFRRYLDIKTDMYAAERLQIYFHGHADCFAYLKKIGAV